MDLNFCRKGIWKSLLALSVVAIMLCAVVVISVFGAQTTRRGKVTGVTPDPLRVRDMPNTTGNIMFHLYEGDSVLVIEAVEGKAVIGENNIWYLIEYNGARGYAYSHYITILADETTAPDGTGTEQPPVTPPDMTDFEAYMTAQGFPESYKPYLRELHTKYPNWVFKAQQVQYDFYDAVNREKPNSLVHTSSISSWKSTEGEAYDWNTNTWRIYDASGWVRASEQVIAHYMDPRNFLGENSVFQFLEQSFDANIQNVDGVRNIIANTFMDPAKQSPYLLEPDGTALDYATTIFNAGQTYGVNPYVLAAMIVIEQGTNGSTLISGTYDGYGGAYYGFYNYFNVYAAAPTAEETIRKGLWYAKGGNNGATTFSRPWNTRYKSIMGGAEFYSTGYINAGQNTLYLKRFNVQGNNAFGHQYMTNVYGAASEAEKLAKGYSEELRKAALSFYIPVYKNMPEQAVLRPVVDGSPNMKLRSLSVVGYELTPSFDPDILEYMLVVPPNLSAITVNTIVMQEKAVVSGIGDLALTENKHVFEIKVTAQNGSTRVYKLTVAKENSADFGTVTFTGNYNLSNFMALGIQPNMTVADFQTKLLSQGSIAVTNSAGVAKDASSAIGTGDIIKVISTNGMPYGEYTAVVKGDVNCDGKLTVTDLIKIRNRILGTQTMSGIEEKAADVDMGGKINVSDLIKVRNHILGTIPIA